MKKCPSTESGYKVNIMPQVCNRKDLAANAFWEEIDEKYFQDVPLLLLNAVKSNISEGTPTLHDADVSEKEKDYHSAKYQVDCQASVTLTPHHIKSPYIMSPWENRIFEKFFKEFVSKNSDFKMFKKELERWIMETDHGQYENRINLNENIESSMTQEAFQEDKGVTYDWSELTSNCLNKSLKCNGSVMEPVLSCVDVLKKRRFTRVVYSFSSWGFRRSNYTEEIRQVLKNNKDWKCFVEKFLVCYIKFLDKENRKVSESKESHLLTKPVSMTFFLGLVQSVLGPLKVETGDSLNMETLTQYGFPHWFSRMLQNCDDKKVIQTEETQEISLNRSCIKKEIQKLTVDLDVIQQRKSIMLQKILSVIQETKKPCKMYWNAVEAALVDLYRYEVFHSVTSGYYAYSLSKQYYDLNFFRILSALNGLGISGWWTEQGLCSVCGSGVTYDEDPLVFCDACFIPAHHGCVGYPVVSVSVDNVPKNITQDSFVYGSKMYFAGTHEKNESRSVAETNASKEGIYSTDGDDWFCDACHLVIQQVSNVPLALVIIRHLAGPRTPYDFQELLNYKRCNQLPQQFTLKLPCLIDDEAHSLVKFPITDTACRVCFSKTSCTEDLSIVGCKQSVSNTVCETNRVTEDTIHSKKGISRGVPVKKRTHSLTGMHCAAVGEWKRWLVQVSQEEVTRTAEMLRKKIREKNNRAKDSWMFNTSMCKKKDALWCVAGSSCTPGDQITKIICLPVCSLCGYDPYFRGGGVIKKVNSKQKSEFCHIRCALAAHGILSRDTVHYNPNRLRSATPCTSCGESGPDVVGCSTPGCLVSYHMSCGTQMRQCFLDFVQSRPILFCETHAKDHLPSQSLRRYETCRQRRKSQWMKRKTQMNSSVPMTLVSASLYNFAIRNSRQPFINAWNLKNVARISTKSSALWTGNILDETLWMLLDLYKGGKKKKVLYSSLYLKCVGIKWPSALWNSCLRLYYSITGELPTQQHKLHALSEIVDQCMNERRFEVRQSQTIGHQTQDATLCSSCCAEKTSCQTRLSLITCILCHMSVCMECLKGTTIHESSTLSNKVTSDSFVCLRCQKKKDAVCELCYRHDGYLIWLQTTTTWIHSLCYQWFCKKNYNELGTYLLRDCTNILQHKNLCLFCFNPFGSTWVCDYGTCSNAFHISCCSLWGCTMKVRKTGETLSYNAYCPDHSYNKEKSDWYCRIKRKLQSWGGHVGSITDNEFPLSFIQCFMFSIYIPKPLDWSETIHSLESYTLPFKRSLKKSSEVIEEGKIQSQQQKSQKSVSSIISSVVTNQMSFCVKSKNKRKSTCCNESSMESSDDSFSKGFFSETQWTKILLKIKQTLKRSSTFDLDHVKEEIQRIYDMNKKKNVNSENAVLPRVKKKIKCDTAAIEHQPKRRGRPRKIFIEQEECAKTQVQLTTDATNNHELKENKRRRPLMSHSIYTPLLENFSSPYYGLNKQCVEPCSFTALPMTPFSKTTTCSPYLLAFSYPYYQPYQMTPFLTNIYNPANTTNGPFQQYAEHSFYPMFNSVNTFAHNQHYFPPYATLPRQTGSNQERLPTQILPRQEVEQGVQSKQDVSRKGVLKTDGSLTSRGVE
ncbi:uncharacterized protein LOC128883915 isoform X2 [Hylaeus volcanicus]|uniref:uncharacterized protein LOC128883915 isoform X2 n=1 Tax=Hylaeus volcanicus TaxID=313075 RepID=UPI0023B7C6C8|nr:uncharacterized protein LOC128883915 isoform X2 [Hylaeus volcanicus]